jgi:hypothetical protein
MAIIYFRVTCKEASLTTLPQIIPYFHSPVAVCSFRSKHQHHYKCLQQHTPLCTHTLRIMRTETFVVYHYIPRT